MIVKNEPLGYFMLIEENDFNLSGGERLKKIREIQEINISIEQKGRKMEKIQKILMKVRQKI